MYMDFHFPGSEHVITMGDVTLVLYPKRKNNYFINILLLKAIPGLMEPQAKKERMAIMVVKAKKEIRA